MKKKIYLILLSLILVVSLTACHGKKKQISFIMPDEFNESETYEISFWAKNDSNVSQKKIYEKAITDFEEIYPNITVTLKSYTNYEDIYRDVITNISTNTTPNVCITYPDHVATYMTGTNVIVPLNSLMDNPKYGFGGTDVKFENITRSDMIEKFLNEGNFNGSYYTIPFMRSSECLYINKTYVEKLGYSIPEFVTWEWVFAISEIAKSDPKILIPFIYKSSDNMMIQMLRQLNAGYTNEFGDINLYNSDSERIVLELSDKVEKGIFSTFAYSSYPGNKFNRGECIFAIDSTAGATWIGYNSPQSEVNNDDCEEFETVIRPVPQYDVSNPQMISQGPSLCIFNKEDGNEVLASWLFTEFLLSNSVQVAYAETEGYVPVTSKAQNSDEYQEYLNDKGKNNYKWYPTKIEASELVMKYTDYTFITPVFNGSSAVRQAAGKMIDKMVFSVKAHDKIDEEYIKQLEKDITALYRLDQIEQQMKSDRGSGKLTLGKLSNTAIVMLSILAFTWVCLISYFIHDFVKKKKSNKRKGN